MHVLPQQKLHVVVTAPRPSILLSPITQAWPVAHYTLRLRSSTQLAPAAAAGSRRFSRQLQRCKAWSLMTLSLAGPTTTMGQGSGSDTLMCLSP
jgi:hypothetical protein